MPDTDLPRTLQGYLGCDWTSLTPQEEDVALLMRTLAHNREGLVPIHPALNGRARVLGTSGR